MSLYKRYTSYFPSDVGNHLYNIEIWQEADAPWTIETIQMAGDPVCIEWIKKEKLEPIRSSSATIRLLCMNDRKFTDLYTVEVKRVRIDIYRDGALYWSGTIDTELYEEPYYTDRGYVVTLTFSDFAVLSRIKWNGTGFKTINQLLSSCIDAAGLAPMQVHKQISTRLSSVDTSDLFESLSIVSDNFYNEDGEADTLKDVLSYTLRPFTAHIQQKNGAIHIYDTQALSNAGATRVRWVRKDSSLGVDRVYNNAQITFSAYEKSNLLHAEMEEKDFPAPEDGVTISVDKSKQAQGFKIKFEDGHGSVFHIAAGTGARYFCIVPTYSGDESRGVAYCCKPETANYLHGATSCMANGTHSKGELFSVMEQPYIGYVSSRRFEYKLKICLTFMYDVRYNPFEQSGDDNEKENYEKLQNWCNFAYVPIRLIVRDSEGNALYHYRNSNMLPVDGYTASGSWVAGEGNWGDCYLSYYDTKDRKSATGLGGWSVNKQTIGYYRKDLPQRITLRGDGEYIDLPPCAGWLDVRVGEGIYQFDYKREEKDIYSRTRWVLYKSVSIDLTDKYGNDLSLHDQVHEAWLERAAEESYTMETHIGTMRKPSPVARGALIRTGSYDIVSEFYRNGVYAGIEELAIGTIYSQFSSRKNLLSGTVELLPDMGAVSDKHTPGNFMVTGELQHLQADTSNITMIETNEDNYQGTRQ